MRLLIDTILGAGKKRLSPQTGWIHLCYESEGSRHDTIPLLENFSFVLALFRSRLSDDVLLGREMLEKLLAFEVDGHFPVYLHEFPHVRDRGLSIDILAYLLHLKREFSNVLGENLESQVRSLIVRIIETVSKEEHCSYGRKAKLLAAQGKFHLAADRKINSSAQLAEELIALQLQGEYTESDLLSITRFWHSGLMIYHGPYARELQEGFESAPTLFDLFMGRTLNGDHPIYLRASLVYPLPFPAPKVDNSPYSWLSDQESKAVHLFWRGSDMTHSLVIQGATRWQELGDSNFAIDCALSEEGPKEGEEKSEVNCFFNYHPDHAIRIGQNERGSAFSLDRKFRVQSQPLTLDFQAFVLEGEGTFYGHILRGNRHRQIALRGEKRFNAYDWQIALRTLVRKGPCTVRLLCSIKV